MNLHGLVHYGPDFATDCIKMGLLAFAEDLIRRKLVRIRQETYEFAVRRCDAAALRMLLAVDDLQLPMDDYRSKGSVLWWWNRGVDIDAARAVANKVHDVPGALAFLDAYWEITTTNARDDASFRKRCDQCCVRRPGEKKHREFDVAHRQRVSLLEMLSYHAMHANNRKLLMVLSSRGQLDTRLLSHRYADQRVTGKTMRFLEKRLKVQMFEPEDVPSALDKQVRIVDDILGLDFDRFKFVLDHEMSLSPYWAHHLRQFTSSWTPEMTDAREAFIERCRSELKLPVQSPVPVKLAGLES